MPYRVKDIVHSLDQVAGAVRVSADPSIHGARIDEGLVKIDHTSVRLSDLERSGSAKLVALGDDAVIQALAGDVDDAIRLIDAERPEQAEVRTAFEKSLDLTDRIQSILEGDPTTDPFGEDDRGYGAAIPDGGASADPFGEGRDRSSESSSGGDAAPGPFEDRPDPSDESMLEGDPTTDPFGDDDGYEDDARPEA